jgi:hypothetical protein
MRINSEGYEFADWWTGRDSENYFSEWGRLKKPFHNRRSYSVCHNCKKIYYHTLVNCPTCPGKFVHIEGSAEELAEKLKGYKLGAY